ncbi:MAG: type IV secretion system DNA-binding domain-containing protein [Patescibacteria group bacterium]|nr:type IV secretion system DNA-binding domain-containing protein [Patescibacteria group bacterium]
MSKENKITLLGETTFRNQRKRFGIKTDDRRRHVYVVGKTGMGKTALLENMVIQDIRDGKGVGVVDPHGEAAEKILDFIPAERINDVIYFNPADLNYPMPFNVMEKVDPEYRHLVASGLMEVFKKIWPDVWSARMEYILSNSILALLEDPNSTLLGVNRMLADPEYRKQIVAKVKDPMVKSFWNNEFARYTQRYEVEATAAIQNKIGQLISNPLIRNIIGQVKSRLNMRELMDDGKILIANLSKGKIGEENSRLLGALLITKLQLAAMSRVDIPEKQRKDFFLYVDEFQNFATEAFANILSEARKYRLSLVLANQYMAQLEEMTALGRSTKVRDAVFGNVGTFIVFRVGAEDAEYLEKEFVPEITAEDFVNLAKYNVYIKLMIDGVAGRPFSAHTLEPYKFPDQSHKDKIIMVARERYSIERSVVEEKIKRWMEEEKVSETFYSEKKSSPMHDAVCSSCSKQIKVNFKPEPGRPVYCKDCLKKRRKKDEKLSLDQVKRIEPLSFSSTRKIVDKEKPKREKSQIDLDKLKKNLEKALKKEK